MEIFTNELYVKGNRDVESPTVSDFDSQDYKNPKYTSQSSKSYFTEYQSKKLFPYENQITPNRITPNRTRRWSVKDKDITSDQISCKNVTSTKNDFIMPSIHSNSTQLRRASETFNCSNRNRSYRDSKPSISLQRRQSSTLPQLSPTGDYSTTTILNNNVDDGPLMNDSMMSMNEEIGRLFQDYDEYKGNQSSRPSTVASTNRNRNRINQFDNFKQSRSTSISSSNLDDSSYIKASSASSKSFTSTASSSLDFVHQLSQSDKFPLSLSVEEIENADLSNTNFQKAMKYLKIPQKKEIVELPVQDKRKLLHVEKLRRIFEHVPEYMKEGFKKKNLEKIKSTKAPTSDRFFF